MRATLGVIASGQIEPTVNFAFDAEGEAAAQTGLPVSSPRTWTHTPVGIPKGVVVLCATENSGGASRVTAMTYGGVAMTQVSGSPLHCISGDSTATLEGFVLTSGIPTGAQTVSATLTGTTGYGSINFASYTVVGPNNSAVEDTSTVDTTGANPTVALTIANESFVCGVLASGRDVSGDVVVGTGMTHDFKLDVGGQVMAFAHKTALISSNDSVDWTVVSDRYGILAVALKST
jgi:hypothetical protein